VAQKVLSNLGTLYANLGYAGKAQEILEAVVEDQIASHGPRHPDVGVAYAKLAVAYFNGGRPGKGRSLAKRALKILRRSLGAEHPSAAHAMRQLARMYAIGKRLGKAEAMYRELWAAQEAYGKTPPRKLAETLEALRDICVERGRHKKAEPVSRRYLEIKQEILGGGSPLLAEALRAHASILQEQDKEAEAYRYQVRAERIRTDYLASR